LYQYVDQSPPSWVGTSGSGSAKPTSVAFAGSVKSTTLIPDW
jgi:hypothetical protein